MRIRIFEGGSWGAARPLGDFAFDQVPAVGDKMVVAAETGWATGVVRDVVHRIVDAGDPADVALLVTAMTTTEDRSELPFAAMDRVARPATAAANPAPADAPPRRGPWR